jgi:hypothetical protein
MFATQDLGQIRRSCYLKSLGGVVVDHDVDKFQVVILHDWILFIYLCDRHRFLGILAPLFLSNRLHELKNISSAFEKFSPSASIVVHRWLAPFEHTNLSEKPSA